MSEEVKKIVMSQAEKNLHLMKLPLIVYGIIAGTVLAFQPGKLIW